MGKGFCSLGEPLGLSLEEKVSREKKILWQHKGILGTERIIVLPGSDRNISFTHF